MTGTKEFSCVCAVQLPRYHAKLDFHLMVSMCSASPHARNTMKNTIDDADYIINLVVLIVINQCIKKSGHSHSMVAGGLQEMS
jgi:hypothetical protein